MQPCRLSHGTLQPQGQDRIETVWTVSVFRRHLVVLYAVILNRSDKGRNTSKY